MRIIDQFELSTCIVCLPSKLQFALFLSPTREYKSQNEEKGFEQK